MSGPIKDGGPAFPVIESMPRDIGSGSEYVTTITDTYSTGGMTLRDYFAAKAMPFLAGRADLDNTGPVEWAGACYEIADAMLAARQAQS